MAEEGGVVVWLAGKQNCTDIESSLIWCKLESRAQHYILETNQAEIYCIHQRVQYNTEVYF